MDLYCQGLGTMSYFLLAEIKLSDKSRGKISKKKSLFS